MDCDKIQALIPGYFNHTASEEEVKIVEEHLCICHNCRTLLGELMDKEAFSTDSGSPSKDSADKTPSEAAAQQGSSEIQYFPAKDFEDMLKKPPEPVEDYPDKKASSESQGPKTPGQNSDKTGSDETALESSGIEYVSNLNQDGPVQASKKDSSSGGIDEVFPLDEEVPLESLDEEPSPKTPPKKEDTKDCGSKVIQTPLGPITLNDDDDGTEEEPDQPELAPEKDEPKKDFTPSGKVIQTPLGPTSLDDEIEGDTVLPDKPAVKPNDNKKEPAQSDDKITPAAFGSMPSPSASKDGIDLGGLDEHDASKAPENDWQKEKGSEPLAPRPYEAPAPVVNDEPMYSGEHSDMAPIKQEMHHEELSRASRREKFELDQTPIAPEPAGMFNYVAIGIAIAAFIFVLYLFFQMKG